MVMATTNGVFLVSREKRMLPYTLKILTFSTKHYKIVLLHRVQGPHQRALSCKDSRICAIGANLPIFTTTIFSRMGWQLASKGQSGHGTDFHAICSDHEIQCVGWIGGITRSWVRSTLQFCAVLEAASSRSRRGFSWVIWGLEGGGTPPSSRHRPINIISYPHGRFSAHLRVQLMLPFAPKPISCC